MDQQTKPLVNRVQASGLITLDLETFGPQAVLHEFDLKQFLWQELVLREKEFRTALKEHDWSQYEGDTLLVYCSTDAIIPTWAYMLVASYGVDNNITVFQGTRSAFLESWYQEQIARIDAESYRDARIVVKGCGTETVPASAYSNLVIKLQPVVKSLMYGEPCSTVPVFKRRPK